MTIADAHRGRGGGRRRGELGCGRARRAGRAPSKRSRRSSLGTSPAAPSTSGSWRCCGSRSCPRSRVWCRPGCAVAVHACNDQRVVERSKRSAREHPGRHRQQLRSARSRWSTRSASRSSRSRSASATRSSSTARSSAPTSSGTGSEHSKLLPETAAPSAGAFEAKFRELLARGATGIVCINLSSHLSATMQAAQVAAAAVSGDIPVQVIDSQSASMGLGNLCLTAARRAADGDSLESIVDRGRQPARPHQAVRDPRHARVPEARGPRRQRPGPARHRAVDQAGDRGARRRRRGGGQGPHPVEGAQAARGQGGGGEDRAPRGAARQGARPRRAARAAGAGVPPRRHHHRRRRAGHRHPRRARGSSA